MGLDYDSTVMLTCKLLFAAAKAIVDVGPHICPGSHKLYLLDFFFVQDQVHECWGDGGVGGFKYPTPLSRTHVSVDKRPP